MKFTTILLMAGKTATGFEVPPEVVEGLGAGKRPPVLVTINGYTYRNTVMPYAGAYMVGVRAEHRVGANIQGGDSIEVDIELDTQPREAEIPDALAERLGHHPELKARFEALSYTNKKEMARTITDAKTEETRQRRLDKAMAVLNRYEL